MNDPDVLWLTSHGFQECTDTCAMHFQRNGISVTRYWSRCNEFRWVAEAHIIGGGLPHTADANSAAGAVEGLCQLAQHIALEAARSARDIAHIMETTPGVWPTCS